MVSSTRPSAATSHRDSDTARGGNPVGGDNDIYTDPKIANSVIATAVREDPLFRFLAHSWRTVVVVVLAVIAAWYAWNGFQSTREDSVRHSADLFARMRAEYDETLTLRRERARLKKELAELDAGTSASTQKAKAEAPDEKTPAEKRARLEVVEKDLPTAIARAQQSARALRDARPPYSELAPLYLTLLDREEGAEVNASPPSVSWRDAPEGERLLRELEWYAFARSKLDAPTQGGEAGREQGRKLLTELATGATYVRAPAALVLAQTASGDAERAAARDLIVKIEGDQPDQSEILSGALRSLE